MMDVIEQVSRTIDRDVWVAIDRGALQDAKIPAIKEQLYAKAREVVLAVLRSVREPSGRATLMACGAADFTLPVRPASGQTYVGEQVRRMTLAHAAMIDSLIQELDT